MIRAKKLDDTINNIEREKTPTIFKNNENTSFQTETVAQEQPEFFAFARVFSGTLKKGQTLFILSPKHNPEDFFNDNVSTGIFSFYLKVPFFH